jgi:hypothetical protein
VRLNLSKQKGKEKRGSTADAVSSPPVVLSLYSFFFVCKGEVCIWTATEIEMLHAVYSSVHNKGGASHFFFSRCYAASLKLQFVLLLLFVPPNLLERSRSSLLLLCEVCCSVLFKRKPEVKLN